MLAGVLAPLITGITVNITDPKDTAKSARLRGLSLNGVGTGIHGINVIAADKVTVEDCVIDGFKNGINVAAGTVFVANTTIRNNVGPGINVAARGQVAMTEVNLIFNGTATAGAASSITSFNNVVLYGNKR